MSKGRIFSGMQPSGKFHLGNYLGALENWVRLQNDYECFFSIVDLHALTSKFEDTGSLPENIHHMALDWLSAGLDPERNIIFIQSQVKEHHELHLLLSMMTPLSWLERVPTYKDKLQQLGAQGKDINTYGFLGYPVLMTADIVLYKADTVPVGEDQIPHLELAREIVRRFNHLYRPVFPEPLAQLSKAPLLPGIDGRKMSKSYGNEIPYAASPDEIRGRVRLIVTDPQRVKKSDPGNPAVCTAYKFHEIFNASQLDAINAGCRQANIGCVDCKKNLAEQMVVHLADIHVRRDKYAANPARVKEILFYGAERARKVAAATMEEVRQAMHL
ncbi:tryptophan--tRNA ligase|uniref:Tryptophan--tRNA ligase n=1 Tax=Dendrosporobacter quercicolus TaxID=146817 RepID=A0A1G9L298_9FIRM|nr:tryptophan--tRNA ligase [Dendrosporobacter quercicolus]NSL46569.1 tryptophan--tRNA ligase [Dendrosporobacter quercicolus DSM 1736]SDL56071.1 tryptophanyl-tRNA synthetase [Dendrosporobacter quercicolus]